MVFVFKLKVIRSFPELRVTHTDLVLCSFMVVFPFGKIMKLEGHVISARRCVAPPIFMTPPTAHGSADFDELMNLLVPGGKGGAGGVSDPSL